ncbi:MAG TPA: UDP-N-acetylmuramate dehydrogenase [Flavisolibacter sp.]|jgi:UDP-N-acetylmuramate dehydrogenase
MQIRENISLRPYNTFGIDAIARQFAVFSSVDELKELMDDRQLSTGNRLVLGGGSNILLTGDYEGLVLKNEIMGMEVVNEDEDHIYVKAGAGENWHRFVMHCVEKEYAGLENLSLIPGNVGASPMQNIGAYGVEIKEVFHELEAWHIEDRTLHNFSASDCEFGYRESVFKRKYRDRFVIASVTYRLSRKPHFNISYGAIKEELERMGVQELSIRAVSDAVIRIRSSKLPDPKETGNAGSFFKNPLIPNEQFIPLKEAFPNIVAFPAGNGHTKLAAGWLIEQCGWKGFRRGDAGCYPKQALVLVNYGNATGREVFQLSEEIIASVKNKFGVELEREVNLVG